MPSERHSTQVSTCSNRKGWGEVEVRRVVNTPGNEADAYAWLSVGGIGLRQRLKDRASSVVATGAVDNALEAARGRRRSLDVSHVSLREPVVRWHEGPHLRVCPRAGAKLPVRQEGVDDPCERRPWTGVSLVKCSSTIGTVWATPRPTSIDRLPARVCGSGVPSCVEPQASVLEQAGRQDPRSEKPDPPGGEPPLDEAGVHLVRSIGDHACVSGMVPLLPEHPSVGIHVQIDLVEGLGAIFPETEYQRAGRGQAGVGTLWRKTGEVHPLG